jgi:hypothetical protein
VQLCGTFHSVVIGGSGSAEESSVSLLAGAPAAMLLALEAAVGLEPSSGVVVVSDDMTLTRNLPHTPEAMMSQTVVYGFRVTRESSLRRSIVSSWLAWGNRSPPGRQRLPALDKGCHLVCVCESRVGRGDVAGLRSSESIKRGKEFGRFCRQIKEVRTEC